MDDAQVPPDSTNRSGAPPPARRTWPRFDPDEHAPNIDPARSKLDQCFQELRQKILNGGVVLRGF
jgi:hypothetical protein